METRGRETSTNSIGENRRDSEPQPGSPPEAAALRSGGEGIFQCVLRFVTVNAPFLERESREWMQSNITSVLMTEEDDAGETGTELRSEFLSRTRPDLYMQMQ